MTMAVKEFFSKMKPLVGIIAVILAVLILGVAGWFIAKKVKNSPIAQNSQNQNTNQTELTAEQIQDIFRKTPEGSTTPAPLAQAPPTNPASPTPPPSNSSNISPRGEVAGTATVSGAYRNTDLGIELAVPTGWKANQTDKSHLTFTDDRGRNVSWIETSPASINTDDLAKQLRQSPAVSNLQPVTIAGQAGWKFSLNSGPGQGLAIIANGKLYYIFGDLVASPVLPTLKFL